MTVEQWALIIGAIGGLIVGGVPGIGGFILAWRTSRVAVRKSEFDLLRDAYEERCKMFQEQIAELKLENVALRERLGMPPVARHKHTGPLSGD